INEKKIRSRLETIHRHDKPCPIKKANFNQQAKRVAKLITVARRNYFSNLISNCSTQPKKLWTALNSVLSRNTPPCLPTCHSTAQLATSFMDFFTDKITKLCSSLNPINFQFSVLRILLLLPFLL